MARDESGIGSESLRKLLERYNEHPDERQQVLAEIDRRFTRRLSIMVVDAWGFSRTVQEMGIVHFLAMLERLERVIAPAVEEEGGRILRREADNVFAVFPDPASALRTARRVLEDLVAVNEALPRDEEMAVSIGIGYGDVLVVAEDDVFGDQMNMASKLGEDLAERDEILLTDEAHAALPEGDRDGFERLEYAISGLSLTAHRLAAGG
ncbi:MAG: adenylate/guanylate cyclase domain-containing protein [Actinobacteria bacterium]|nr:adenylate/guanylate cyclase domain-containing protein [Actinomycetota bacterium]